ncbi:MAG: hypothetical protein P0S95_02120 [Rhabdochlamydiaceae bacterium]|nr:hypothetical protein [Candidatus Amphrikana amoebophyrae]
MIVELRSINPNSQCTIKVNSHVTPKSSRAIAFRIGPDTRFSEILANSLRKLSLPSGSQMVIKYGGQVMESTAKVALYCIFERATFELSNEQ